MFQMVQTMVSAGWQMIARSNGLVVNNTPVSNPYPYSSNNVGFTASQDLGNPRAWFVIQQPPQITGSINGGGRPAPWAGTRQLCFQRNTAVSGAGNDVSWRIKYSFTGAYTSPSSVGTSTVTPAANTILNDEIYIIGGGTDVTPTFATFWGGTLGGSRLNVFADDGSLTGSLSGSTNLTGTTPNPWPYGFYMLTFTNGGASGIGTVLMMDPLISGSFPPQEVDPFVYYCDNAVNNPLIAVTPATPTAFNGYTITAGQSAVPVVATWFKKGQSGGQFVSVGAQTLWVKNQSPSAIKQIDPIFMGSNFETFLDDLIPVPYARPFTPGTINPTRGFGGYKGISAFVRWCPRNLSIGATYSVFGNRDRVIWGNAVLPWDTSNVLV